jgi:hypothetical protein
MRNIYVALAAICLICGCKAPTSSTIVFTTTVLGFEVAQNPVSQMYQARLGYVRAEAAYTPSTNSDLITEMRWNSIFTTGGLYQRMAIGKTAVDNSMYMFVKDDNGKIDTNTVTKLISIGEAKIKAANTNR